jgi:hypothetical protein
MAVLVVLLHMQWAGKITTHRPQGTFLTFLDVVWVLAVGGKATVSYTRFLHVFAASD